MKKTITLILFTILLASCSSTKELQKKNITSSKVSVDTALINIPPIQNNHFATNDNISIKSNLSINFPNQNNSVSSTIEIAGMDSILIKISAIFGISVGQLYANQNEFIMNNNLESITYIGIPTEENIMKTAFIPLSFYDLVSILKCVPSQDINNYIYKTNDNIFEYISTNKIEHIKLDDSFSLLQVIRMDNRGNEIFSVEYNDYIKLGEKKLAKKITIRFPQQRGNVEITYSDIQFKDNPTSPMRIVKPKSYKLQEIN